MQIHTIETPSLGDRSYVVTDGSVAAVIDPQRDLDRVLALVSEHGLRVTDVFALGGQEDGTMTLAALLRRRRTFEEDGDERIIAEQFLELQAAYRYFDDDWETWFDFYNEVIDPLVAEGATISLRIHLDAQAEAGIDANTIELRIKESLQQRGLDAEVRVS